MTGVPLSVVLLTALDGRSDRVAGLEAGADEFLTKPIDDVMLFARVRSLTRLKSVIDELRDLHLGIPRPNPDAPRASDQLRAAYEAAVLDETTSEVAGS